MPKIIAKRLRVRRDKDSPWSDIPAAVVRKTGGGSGLAYEIGFGLNVSEDYVLSAEVGASSFKEIPNTKVQEIFNKVMED